MYMDDLNEPMKLNCGQILKNKIGLAPLTNKQSNEDGTLNDRELEWLKLRGGHYGLISTCATYVSKDGKAWEGQLGLSEDRHIKNLQRLTDEIKMSGSKIITQLHHGGDKAVFSNDKISCYDDTNIKVRNASKEELQEIINNYVLAAKRAEKAGFNGIEIHGANGYLFTQFLSHNTNKRNDEYGGDIEGRSRLLLETVEAVRRNVSKNFMVNVRISPVNTYSLKGIDIEETILVAKWLDELNIDILSLSLREYNMETIFEDQNYPVIQLIRDETNNNLKIATAGNIWSRADAVNAREIGADMILLGRAGIVHPDWPTVSSKKNFKPYYPKWDPAIFQKVGVSNVFHNYLMKFPGLVMGGAEKR